MIIKLNTLTLHGFHGIHEVEKTNGNTFELEVQLSVFADPKSMNDDVTKTVDYAAITSLIEKVFDTPQNLIETVAQNIVDEIKRYSKMVHGVSVEIKKLNPPINQTIQSISVIVEG